MSALIYIKAIFSWSLFTVPPGVGGVGSTLLLLIVGFVLIEWFQKDKEYGLDFTNIKINSIFRWSIYYFIIILIITYGAKAQDFIYFQF